MQEKRFRPAQAKWTVVAMLAGAAIGYWFPDSASGVFHATQLQILSTIFLRLIQALIAPLLFGTLVVGVAGYGDEIGKLGRLAARSFLYFEVVTTLALVIGLTVANLVHPGRGVELGAASAETGQQLAQTPITLMGMVEHAVPRSFFEAAAGNQVLAIVVFSIIFGLALGQVRGPARDLVLSMCDALSQVMFKFTGVVMLLAPFGIGGAVAATVGRSGLGMLSHLGFLVLTLYGSLIAFALLVLLPVAFFFGVPLLPFLRAVREPWLLAFSTASSESALPMALERMERLGVPRRIVAFVLPAGYSFNMDGTSLYLSLAAVFVAQAAGIVMPLERQLLMVLTLMVTSKGVAAVPRAGLVVLSATLSQFGLPLEGVAVILGVDALMDMGRTSINVVGNCLASAVLARWEGVFGREKTAAPQFGMAAGLNAVLAPRDHEQR